MHNVILLWVFIFLVTSNCYNLNNIAGNMQSCLTEKFKMKSESTKPLHLDGLVINIEHIKEMNEFEKIKISEKLFNDKVINFSSGLEKVSDKCSDTRHKNYVYLALVDVHRNRYDCYRLQLLESNDDKDRRYWVFSVRSCISSHAVNGSKRGLSSLDKAKNYFVKVFKEKTLSSFDNEKFFKYPGYYKLNIDYLEEKSSNTTVDSQLPKSVENLMKLIFDIDFAKKTIEELNVDTEKMRLEEFTLKQIIEAMMVIEEIWHQINRGESQEQFINLSDRYYDLIPYKFSVQKAPIICTHDQVTAEVRNLKGLFAIVQSYNFIQKEICNKISIIDRYNRLTTEIIPIHRSDFEFKILEEYAKITNHQLNDEYELVIEEIFKLSRKSEDERFEPFRKVHNRYLLWHGSFLTNFASILSHGLKIAPPEVPRLGKKFGKGVYFADMISKSTKFCITGEENRTGLMLLCEVALGDIHECTETIVNSKSNLLYELPQNKHSVKRIGKTYPHPDGHYTLDDGVIVPKGCAVTHNTELSLNYNEYVVYNEAQVKMRYLLKINFLRKC